MADYPRTWAPVVWVKKPGTPKEEREMAAKRNHRRTIELNLRVLGYQNKQGEWAAHCLETDLVGRGRSFNEAFRDLNELTEMQVSFAVSMDQLELLNHPAPVEIFIAYERATVAAISAFTGKKNPSGHKVDILPLRSPSRIASEFEPISA